MRTWNRLLTLGLSMTMAVALPASAQVRKNPIAAPADQPYRFRHSGLVIPATIEGMQRTAIDQFGNDELDVFANYERGSDMLTIYVYRNVSGAVPVWFDRARASVEMRRDAYGTVTAAAPPAAFTPPGQDVASGMIGGWSVTKAPYRGTALALLPMGEWLVKVRYSSTTLDGAGAAARLPAVLAALTWPTGLARAASAQPVADCATPLGFSRKAKVVRDQESLSMSALLGGVMASMAADKTGKEDAATDAAPATPQVWCRDATPSPVGGIYRADGATDAYLLAFSDAGRGVTVSPDSIGALLDEKRAPRWSIALVDMGESSTYPPLTALPRPEQVLALIQRPALSRTVTWGEERKVNINLGAIPGKR